MPEITIPKLPDGYDAEIEIKPDGTMKIKLTKSSVVHVPIAAPEPPVKTIPLPIVIPYHEPPLRPIRRWPDIDNGPWWEVTCATPAERKEPTLTAEDVAQITKSTGTTVRINHDSGSPYVTQEELIMWSYPGAGAGLSMLGIDLYDHNPEPDWDALWSLGCRLVYLKASEGGDRQKLFAPRAQRARDKGWLVGGYSYHYAPRANQAEAADLFASMVFESGATDLRPAVDCESLCNASGSVCETPAVTLARIESFVIALEACVGTECVVYTGPGFWAQFGDAGKLSWLCRRALWCADYRPKQSNLWSPTGAPGLPGGWQANRLALWQYDGTTIDKNLVMPGGIELIRWPERELTSRPVLPDMWGMTRDAVDSAERSRKIDD